MTVEEAKMLEGWYKPDYKIGEEVFIKMEKDYSFQNLYLSDKIAIIKKQVPVLADETHFWFWEFDIETDDGKYVKEVPCYYLERTHKQERLNKINSILYQVS